MPDSSPGRRDDDRPAGRREFGTCPPPSQWDVPLVHPDSRAASCIVTICCALGVLVMIGAVLLPLIQ